MKHSKTAVRSLKREFDCLPMEDDELVLDNFRKISRIVVELKRHGEKVPDVDVISKLL